MIRFDTPPSEHIQVSLAEKQFEGCDGLVITDEICVVIAAQACLLLLHRDTDYYPDLKSLKVVDLVPVLFLIQAL